LLRDPDEEQFPSSDSLSDPGGSKRVKPFSSAFSLDLEAIDTLPRTELRSPGIVPDETELPATAGAALRRGMLRMLGTIEHFRLL
jgi:hypothetical protein